MTNLNARDMFVSILSYRLISYRLIEVCRETGYHKAGDQKEKIKRELESKYGFFSYQENNLASFMAGAAEAIERLFPDSATASMMFSFHEKSLFDTFNKLKKLNEKEKVLDGLVKSTFLGSVSLESFKAFVMSFAETGRAKSDIETWFSLYSEGEASFLNLLESIVNALRENKNQDWLA